MRTMLILPTQWYPRAMSHLRNGSADADQLSVILLTPAKMNTMLVQAKFPSTNPYKHITFAAGSFGSLDERGTEFGDQLV